MLQGQYLTCIKDHLKIFTIEIFKIKIINYQERIEICLPKHLSDIYMPSLSLESINKDGNFVSEEYKSLSDIASKLKTFLILAGVSENILISLLKPSIHHISSVIECNYFKEMSVNAKKKIPSFNYENNIIEFQKLDTVNLLAVINSLQNSAELLSVTFEEVDDFGLMNWGYYGSKARVVNYFHWSLKNSKIFHHNNNV